MGAVIKVGAKVIGWGAASGAGLYGLIKPHTRFFYLYQINQNFNII